MPNNVGKPTIKTSEGLFSSLFSYEGGGSVSGEVNVTQVAYQRAQVIVCVRVRQGSPHH